MFKRVIQRAFLAVAVIGVSLTASSAMADDDYGYGRYNSSYYAGDYDYGYDHCEYRWVTKYVIKTIPVRQRVLRYRECGTPYYVWNTYYKQIEVPVRYRVKVCH